jgi:hypothetical protein
MNSREYGRGVGTRIVWGVASLFAVVGLVVAQGDKDAGKPPKSAGASANKYIGAEKCKNCHGSETKTQYTSWQKTGHAKAFETLGTDAAKKLGKEKGIDDPQTSDKCLKCHETAFGAAADLIKIAMLRLDRELRARKLHSKLLLQVHDELVLESPEPEVEQVKALVQECMENAHPVSVPLDVEVSVGKNWRDME